MLVQERIKAINDIVTQMSEAEQEALLKALKKQILLDKAAALNKSIKKNNIDIEQIVNEVRKVRAKA